MNSQSIKKHLHTFMIQNYPTIRITAVLIIISAVFSCNIESTSAKKLTENEISIPEILKGKSEIESFVSSCVTEIRNLSIQQQQLVGEYQTITDERNRKNDLMAEVKKVTIHGRINDAFTKLSLINYEINLKSSTCEVKLNEEQKAAFNLIKRQLKNEIEQMMIEYKSNLKNKIQEKTYSKN